MDIGELQTKGRVYVQYPPELRAGVEEAVRAWKAFCDLPEEAKTRFPYSKDHKTSGNGYELKKGEVLDLKENFHLREIVADEFKESAKIVHETIGPAFIEKATAVTALLAPLMREFTQAAEDAYGMSGFSDDVLVNQPRWLLRFLHYFPGKEAGEEIAAPHTDKGGFTLHLYESAPGVEQLTYDREWVSMPLSEGETVIIPGMGLQNRSKCQLKATCHRVIATEEVAKEGRYAAVCFFNFRNQRFFDKDRFGPQQAWASGCFYDMPYEEFDTYFID